MQGLNRRKFLGASSALVAGCAADLTFLAPYGHAAATLTNIDPAEVTFGPETDRLLQLFRSTSREQCVPAFAREVKAGLSYQQFLTVLFLAAVENGDPHQVAQVYGAHRISTEVRVEERLLPLFWILNRIKQETEKGAAPNPALRPFKGTLPRADQAAQIFHQALLKSDSAEAERAALALARQHGARFVMHRLWEFASRNVGGTLGHPAIALANSHRALDAMGWQHAHVALRYVTGYISGQKNDRTYLPNLERVNQTAPQFPVDWASAESDTTATLDLYKLLRAGQADESCALICSQLLSKNVKAGAAWDAIHLAAADSVSRHKIGSSMLGAQIHAVTTVNALRYGFDLVEDSRVKLINLLQAAGVICDFYVRHVQREGHLRELNLLDLQASDEQPKGTIRDVFEMLPIKSREYVPKNPEDRDASDAACRLALTLLRDANQHSAFMQAARSFLCVKATMDPHDFKYPAAVFEDAQLVSPEWRPYLLASSVHALHGRKSSDTPTLVQVKEVLK